MTPEQRNHQTIGKNISALIEARSAMFRVEPWAQHADALRVIDISLKEAIDFLLKAFNAANPDDTAQRSATE